MCGRRNSGSKGIKADRGQTTHLKSRRDAASGVAVRARGDRGRWNAVLTRLVLSGEDFSHRVLRDLIEAEVR